MRQEESQSNKSHGWCLWAGEYNPKHTGIVSVIQDFDECRKRKKKKKKGTDLSNFENVVP
jgi:hypothetical protein